MGVEFTGVQALGLGLNWSSTTSQKKIAQDVLDTLSDRRLLHGYINVDRPVEDAEECRASAQECRELLTEAIKRAKVGSPLRAHLRVLRSAFTQFIQLAGRDAASFLRDADQFRLALRVLRLSVARVAESLGEIRGVTVPDELES
ncbi:hypothetical protein SAMN05216223_101121 [Actinacidiphila yanglinensis]|uniref:Uncharacterized protein n=1 Tax=Actinacidiphila yanglinensis TaxID=310779 RepID=A0A1H5SIH9_9ACTN|nr:hypothetical protein [Actinacidiphila yanglinensis]SEF49738.1 hypothetical protein SAMN05216223_101121 [Actinacidiphila yanglinensis]